MSSITRNVKLALWLSILQLTAIAAPPSVAPYWPVRPGHLVSKDNASLSAKLAVEQARIAVGRFDYAGALRTLDAAMRLDPRSPDLATACGMVYLAAEEPGRAAPFFNQALQLAPSFQAAAIGLAAVDMLRRNCKSAELRLRQVLSGPPNAVAGSQINTARALSMLARVLLEANKNGAAGIEAGRALDLDPYNLDALYVLAFVRAAERQPDKVRRLAWQALAIDPRNIPLRRLLSQYVDGQSGYRQSMSQQAWQHCDVGKTLLAEGRQAEAMAQFESALGLEPRCYPALLAKGHILMQQGEFEQAAEAAGRALAVDPEGALAHLELSYAYSGMQERARLAISSTDFETGFYEQAAPAIPDDLMRRVFPDYNSLSERQRFVIRISVAPLAAYLPALAQIGARHYLIPLSQRVSEVDSFHDLAGRTTFDGRRYESIRGVGGRISVCGAEYIEQAARAGYNGIAHEFAHQVQESAMGSSERESIRRLYLRAKRAGRTLDYYAASDEYEYFAQGYEALVSSFKRPATGLTARHTRRELSSMDPGLYRFLLGLSGRPVMRRTVMRPGSRRPETLGRTFPGLDGLFNPGGGF